MSRSKKLKIIITIVCISFIQGLQYCVSPVLGQISEHYRNVDVSLVQMLITVPSLISVFVAVMSGWLVVKISKKKLLLFAGLTAGVTGFIPLFIDSFPLLFAARTVYGISLGLATTLNTAVVAEFFEGDERVAVMGIQGASVGAGMVVVTTAGGWLGAGDFRGSYLINIIGFIALILIAVCLPETGTVKVTNTEKIRLNKEVFTASVFGMLEFFFLITFTTNIAMHLSGPLAGNTAVSGNLTGVFSGIQIIAGLVLGAVAKVTKKFTMPAAMLSFCIGALLLVLFPSNVVMLMAGAVFCGFSQGIFIPSGMVAVANAVPAAAAAMASACFTCGTSLGQFLSPSVLNTVSRTVFGEVTTTNVYLISAIGMGISAVLAFIWKADKSKNKNGGI